MGCLFFPLFPVNGCMDPWYLVLSIKTQIWCFSKWPVLYFKTHTNLGVLKFELCASKYDFELVWIYTSRWYRPPYFSLLMHQGDLKNKRVNFRRHSSHSHSRCHICLTQKFYFWKERKLVINHRLTEGLTDFIMHIQ